MGIKQNNNKSFNVLALLLALLIHAGLIALLYLSFIKTEKENKEEEKLVEVLLIDNTMASSDKEVKAEILGGEKSEKEPSPAKSPEKEKKISPNPEPKKEEPKAKSVDSKPTNTDRLAREKEAVLNAQKEEAERKRKAKEDEINSLVNSAMKGANQQNSSSGIDKGSTSPSNGSGKGTASGSYSLSGRSIAGGGVPVRPNTSKAINGKIVVGILVNPSGKVVDAWIESANIVDADIRKASIKAAKETKFSNIDDINNQKGTITYIFKIQ